MRHGSILGYIPTCPRRRYPAIPVQWDGVANAAAQEEIMNSVHLIGRLATDVDVKEVNGGSKVSSFILAVDRNAEEAGVALLRRLGKA